MWTHAVVIHALWNYRIHTLDVCLIVTHQGHLMISNQWNEFSLGNLEQMKFPVNISTRMFLSLSPTICQNLQFEWSMLIWIELFGGVQVPETYGCVWVTSLARTFFWFSFIFCNIYWVECRYKLIKQSDVGASFEQPLVCALNSTDIWIFFLLKTGQRFFCS